MCDSLFKIVGLCVVVLIVVGIGFIWGGVFMLKTLTASKSF